MKTGDYVRVHGTAYQVPPTATRLSMEMAITVSEDKKIVEKKAKLSEAAKGIVPQNVIGKVVRIVEGIAVLENASTNKLEHADISRCEVIKICKMCYRRETSSSSTDYCKSASCRRSK